MSSPTGFTKIFDSKADRMVGNPICYEAAYTFDGPASYDTGGSLLDLPTNIDHDGTLVLASIEQNDGARTYEIKVDYADVAGPKMVAYVAATEAEVAGTTDLSGVEFRAYFKTLRDEG